MGSLARTRYVCTMDDDFTLADPYVLQDLVSYMDNLYSGESTQPSQNQESEPRAHPIVGFAGCVLHPNPSETYENGFHVNANKFAWSVAHELPWQDGILYTNTVQRRASEARETESGGRTEIKFPGAAVGEQMDGEWRRIAAPC